MESNRQRVGCATIVVTTKFVVRFLLVLDHLMLIGLVFLVGFPACRPFYVTPGAVMPISCILLY